MSEIYDWDTSSGSSYNNSNPPDGWPENMNYSAVNDTGRENMAVVARFINALSANTTAGTGDNYTATVVQTLSAYSKGQLFILEFNRTNTTTSPTLNINTLGAADLVTASGGTLAVGDIQANGHYIVQRSSSKFKILNLSAVFTQAEKTKLAGVEANATADMTDAEVKTAYENNADTNAFTNALLTKLNSTEIFDSTEQSKLAGVEAGAEVNPDTVSQAEAEAGTATTERLWTAQRVAQAIASLGNSYPAQVTDHIRAGNKQLVNGGLSITPYGIDVNVTEGSWESFGGTGSGADNIVTDMDNIPSGAKIAIFDVDVNLTSTGTGQAQFKMHAAVGGTAPTEDDDDNLVKYLRHDFNASNNLFTDTFRLEVPLDSNKRFNLLYRDFNGTGGALLKYRGFITE
jgi:hypothetical protein